MVAILALHNPRKTSSTAGSDTRTSTPVAQTTSPVGHPSTNPATSPAQQSGPASSGAPSGSSSSFTSSAIGSQPLIVLNDTSTPGLAKQAAQLFEGGGWNVLSYDEHYHNVIVSTCAYYDPNTKGAKHAAHTLQKQFPAIQRIAPRFAPAPGGDPLPTGPVVVVLTSDWPTG